MDKSALTNDRKVFTNVMVNIIKRTEVQGRDAIKMITKDIDDNISK